MCADDLRKGLKSRMDVVQREIDRLKKQKDLIDWKLKQAQSQLNIWRGAYEMEADSLGQPSLPLPTTEGKTYRFAGMRLIDALALLRKEQPRISKKEACKILNEEGFNFRTNRHLSAVHFAWIALEQKEKRGGR